MTKENPLADPRSLSDLGLSYYQSHHWQVSSRLLLGHMTWRLVQVAIRSGFEPITYKR